jgi:hypothetical protein
LSFRPVGKHLQAFPLDGGVPMNRDVKNRLWVQRIVHFPEIDLFHKIVAIARVNPVEDVMTNIPPESLPRFRDWIDGRLPSLDRLFHLGSGEPLSEHEKATYRAIAEWLHQHLGQQESNVPGSDESLNGPSDADPAPALSDRGLPIP